MSKTCFDNIEQLKFGLSRRFGLLDASQAQTLRDTVESIPHATDKASAVKALNIINNIVMRLIRNTPQVNNVYPKGKGANVLLKGDDYTIHYEKADWLEEVRHYRKQKLYNPDNSEQFIEIHTLSGVAFANYNTADRLTYVESDF
jgi:hypothetical protein